MPNLNIQSKLNKSKVGIVIVSYNASLMVRITLASLRKAINRTPYNLILIDNASQKHDRREIKKAFDQHRCEIGNSWKYIQLDENKGFAGGNNIGIKEFLTDKTISHICLLNSDVIVTDYWIDRLIGSKCDIVLPVTNKADSSQRIPIDPRLENRSSLILTDGFISPEFYSTVNKFAQEWSKAWNGHIIETIGDTTFFCALLSREIINSLGFLDEEFFPGGYEDNDYCERARAGGYSIFHARDTFIYHFGSSSFINISENYFSKSKKKNLLYFQKKYSRKIIERYSFALLSLIEDLDFVKDKVNWNVLQHKFIRQHLIEINKLIEHILEEHSKLTKMVYELEKGLIINNQEYSEYNKNSEEILNSWMNLSNEFSEKLFTFSYTKSDIVVFQKFLLGLAETVDQLMGKNIEIVNSLQELENEHKAFKTSLNQFFSKRISKFKHLNRQLQKKSKVYRRLFILIKKGKQVMRRLLNFLKILNKENNDDYLDMEKISSKKCDALVQVGNFLSGGLENTVLGINRTLIDKNYSVDLLILGQSGQAANQAELDGTRIHNIKYDPQVYKNLLTMVSPKIVLSHYSIEGSEVCKKLDIPLIQVIHNVYMWFNDSELKNFRQSVKNTNLFIAGSNFSKKYSVERLGVPDEKCIVIPNGIDVQKIWSINREISRSYLRKKFHFSDDDFIFLNVAAITHQKNHLGLIKSFNKSVSNCPNAKLVLIGPTYEKDILYELENFISENNLETRVYYLGKLSEAYKYYFMADAFIHASFFEGGPLVLLEAITANLPIISTNVGFTEYFSNNAGIKVLPPPINIFNFFGSITDLKSNDKFEEKLSELIQETYEHPINPNLPEEKILLMDNHKVYLNYYNVIQDIINYGEVDKEKSIKSWMSD